MPRNIYLEGSVGKAFGPEDPHFTPAQLRAQLEGQGDVTVHVNSGGGVAADGLVIYHMLRDHPGFVTVIVTGAAVSAASLFVMAADKLIMRDGSILMIHDPAADFFGTEDDHRAVAEMLGKLSAGYAGIYAARAGITPEAAREIMRSETWYGPEDAVAAGFADEVETDDAEAPADFAYAAYDHAPRHLLAATRASNPGRRAVLAMMCGQPAKPLKETKMSKVPAALATASEDEDQAAALALEAEDDTTDAEAEGGDGEDILEDVATAEGGDADEDPDDDETPEDEAVAIIDLVLMHGGSLNVARKFIADKTPLMGVVAHYRTKGPSVNKQKPGGATARITRDERDTRRAGIEGAIVARMSRTNEVRGPARDYMALTLPEMAAASIGHRGRVTRGGGEADVIRMAMGSHSTSDFPAIFENALNKRMMSAYQSAAPAYRAIAERMDFADFRPHPIAQVGDFPTLLPVTETGEIKFGTVSDKKESVVLVPYARAMRISRQMMVNDDLQAIDRLLSSRGQAVAAFEDSAFFAMMLSGANGDGPTLLETTRQVFNTTDKTKAGTAAAITPTSVSKGIADMRSRKGVSGETYLAVEPRILLTGPAKEFEAMQLLAPIQAAQASNVNPYVGKLTPVATPYITDNAWHLFADPAAVPSFMYGYLQGESGPRMRMDEPFGQQGIAYSVELDFGVGAIDYRGGFKNAGA
ncbi:head maturation protease, ClpP-related [Oceaniovalibus sp. ACAM 378]|uniref:head maturation protease, ClpP-related n=1 Tax=Oceaniovalibus sp. ACAM 378 TaxID=2599923 RepID=UPI0011D4171A|nr:head maturation protease, ClpP-related [Oceaniovalibus sp. ACAM 378]TYB83945.1 Clp protease ClpP [Oceaniovalibus sp. ACAM 378]